MTEPVKAQLFIAGPLHASRHEIINSLKEVKIKTGDIFCRLGRSSFLGIPFEKLVVKLTKSEYSHASIALVENDEIYMLEINDMGTLLIRLVDWIDYCATNHFSIYRLPLDDKQEKDVKNAIIEFANHDPDYDFIFSDNKKFYCTESVAYVFNQAKIQLSDPVVLKTILSTYYYFLIAPINYLIRKLTGVGLPLNEKVYFVGNSEKGLLATPKLQLICKIQIK